MLLFCPPGLPGEAEVRETKALSAVERMLVAASSWNRQIMAQVSPHLYAGETLGGEGAASERNGHSWLLDRGGAAWQSFVAACE